MADLVLRPVGHVESVLTDRAAAPSQPDEGRAGGHGRAPAANAWTSRSIAVRVEP
jgi:hypothetical protein